MLKNIYRICEMLKEKHPQYFKPYRHPYPATDKPIVVLVFHIDATDALLEVEDFRESMLDLYLFREANGIPYITPSIKIYQDPDIKAVDLNKLKKKLVLLAKKEIFGLNDSNIESIISQISKLDINTGSKYLLTIKVEGKYLGEHPHFAKHLNDCSLDKYKGYKKPSTAVCAMTNAYTDDPYYNVTPLGFTVDKDSYKRSGFSEESVTKMIAVSKEAMAVLDGASSILDAKMSHRLNKDISYFLLPHFLLSNRDEHGKILSRFLEKDLDMEGSSESDHFLGTESFIKKIGERGESEGNVYYDFIFYKRNQSQFKIYSEVSDVLPSRLSLIYSAKKDSESLAGIFLNGESNFAMNLRAIEHLFGESYTGGYGELIASILGGRRIDLGFMVKRMVKVLGRLHKSSNAAFDLKGKYFIKGYPPMYSLLVEYISFLNLFQILNGQKQMQEHTPPKSILEMAEGNTPFLDSDAKKGAFLVGAIAGAVLDAQYRHLKSEPFSKRLNGLTITEPILRRIYKESVAKAKEYESVKNANGYSIIYMKEFNELSSKAALLLMGSMEESTADLSFAFTSGMVLKRNHFNKKQDE